ncbi:heme exporter protein CcmD [Thalassotalea marina]|uniref:Heme exporter protein D n=1 Tax=Thalassotalea marina TaxID=1673741 RepID=A0A919BBJ4_9GAMM|nr:heme exporter protein CcmD [Thalassotalea marina]GHF77482.1 heme exporter protein D [Thalassotalea marina]
MQFNNFAEFIAMDGHGFFVWLSYGITILLFVLITIYSLVNHKSTIKQIHKRQQRELKLKQAAQRNEQE